MMNIKKILLIFALLLIFGKNFAAPSLPSSTASRITVNFNNISVRAALHWLALSQHQNMVMSSHITGKISLLLQDVPWQQAFSAILTMQGLTAETRDNIIYIAPLSEVLIHEKQQQENLNTLPLKSVLLHLNYAKADDIAKLLKDKDRNVLSPRGAVSIDPRTNSLWLRDIDPSLKDAETFIRELDVAVPQVAIEGRIVNIDDDHERDLGIKFNFTHEPLEGLQSLNAASHATSPTDEPLSSLGFALFKLPRGTLVDLELSALESEGHAEIISNPHLVTANQQPALIEAGEEIPDEESASAQGATKTSFKKAVLSLKVIPQITPNNKIILLLQVNQDKRSTQEVKGVPTIDTRQINTQVLVNNGQTVVLGGIYELTRLKSVDRVPFLSDLPGIGLLFRRNKETDLRRELLIFVTPTIIREPYDNDSPDKN
jgi:type IV pilus assembly protein PilQ